MKSESASLFFFIINPLIAGGKIDDRDYLPPYGVSDIELMAVVKYESMKDLLASPEKTWERSKSWREIPIKDPLVGQAAWAYLTVVPPPSSERWAYQMAAPPPSPRRISHRSNVCCEFIRYLVHDVVGENVRRWFGGDGNSVRDCGRVDSVKTQGLT